MPRYKYDFYSWYKNLNEKQEELEYLMYNTDGLLNISYEFKPGKTYKKVSSSVERGAEELEALEDRYWQVVNAARAVRNAVIGIIFNNALGYSIIMSKIEGKMTDSLRIIGGKANNKKRKEAEEEGIEYIKKCLDERNIGYDF